MASHSLRPPSAASPRVAQSTIGLGQGVALYLCALLGAGVLVLPGQAASLAGPASLLAWGFSALLGVPLAVIFAMLASRFPDAGGVATYTARAFGSSAGGITGWWFFLAGSVGQTFVPLTAGYYVSSALALDQRWAPAFALVILATAVAANLVGMTVSARVQVALALGVAAILVSVVAIGLPQIDGARFTPFSPHGITGIGQAVAILFVAFAGWEAVAHLSSEFRNVRRTLPLATMLTIVVITVLYLGIAFVVVGTGAFGSRERDRISLGSIVEGGLGLPAAAVMAVAAVVICLGTTNAFVASLSRLGSALARDGWAPRFLARRSRRGVPGSAVLAVAAIGAAGLLGTVVFDWGTEDIVLVPSVLVQATYLLAAAAAVRLLHGWGRCSALLALLMLAVTVPFAGWHLLIPLSVGLAVIALHRLFGRGPGHRDADRREKGTVIDA